MYRYAQDEKGVRKGLSAGLFRLRAPHSPNYDGQAGRVSDVDYPGVKTPGLSPFIPSELALSQPWPLPN
jgi:hypothetical protein